MEKDTQRYRELYGKAEAFGIGGTEMGLTDGNRQAEIKNLVTSTPVLYGRSFGTNIMEAALIAASGKARRLRHTEHAKVLERLDINPRVQQLN